MKRIWRQLFGILALVIGLGIYLYPDYREWKLMKEVEAITETSQQGYRVQNDQKNHMEPEQAPKETSASEESTEIETEAETESALLDLWRALMDYNIHLAEEKQEITDAWTFRQSPVDIAALNNGSPAVGYIEIPEIELKLPLFVGATEENMSKGAVVLAGTSMPVGGKSTNCVIAGHRGWHNGKYFHDIVSLSKGDMVEITNMWETLHYRVVETKTIESYEVEKIKIQPDRDMITLLTCYYTGSNHKMRFAVYCERVTEFTTERKVWDEKSLYLCSCGERSGRESM